MDNYKLITIYQGVSIYKHKKKSHYIVENYIKIRLVDLRTAKNLVNAFLDFLVENK
jgi:hypothetical protein